MKARYFATPLTRFRLISAFLAATPAFIQAQPAYVPPAGGGLNMAPGAIQPPMYQQPPPYMAPPVMPQRPVPPTPPPGYTPPAGYRPPALARPSVKPTSTPKTPTTASKTKTSTTKKPSTYRPPSTKTPSKSSGSSIETKVARLEDNDFRQDIRLGNLERNVGLLPDSIEGGGVASMAPIGNHYIVRPGDTLLGIASRHGTSTNVLRSLNHMDDDVVDIGQSLLIPSPGGSSYSGGSFTGVHVVKSGDTFTQIARDHGLSTDALARANKTVYPDRLLIGERLVVPGGRSSSRVSSFDTGASFISTASKSSTHTVKKGEHLGSIAKKYGVSTSTLAKANRLRNANIIEIGDRLIIPGRSSGGMSQQLAFTDQDAEPLADFRIPEPPTPPVKPEPIAPLPPINGSAPALTTITTSSSTPRGVVAYRMERGDTLDTVANMFSTTTENIRALNKFPANKVLKEGNELFVPSVGAVSVN